MVIEQVRIHSVERHRIGDRLALPHFEVADVHVAATRGLDCPDDYLWLLRTEFVCCSRRGGDQIAASFE